MILAYLEQALKRAEYAELEDGTFVAEVPGLQGVIGTGGDRGSCTANLQEVVEEWVLVRIARGLPVPPLGGVTVAVKHAS